MLEVIFYFCHRMPGTSSHTYQGSRGKTARILKGVLHTIRDRMPLIEAMDALAQMPLFMKGIFVDQWKYHEETEKIRSKQQFNEAVRQRPEIVEFSDFPNDEDVINTTRDLISLMSEHIDEGQMRHIKANMPGELHLVLEEAMHQRYSQLRENFLRFLLFVKYYLHRQS